MSTCEARQFSDQMQCGRCGLAWDINDPEPPECRRTIDRRAIPDRRVTRAVERLEPTFGPTASQVAHARQVIADYSRECAAGGEPHFPQWAADVLRDAGK